jgi:GT2 family glycosyltransferase
MLSSIIIVTYNGMQYLDGCLSSLRQDVSADCEIIVVDNASTDGSADLVQRRYRDVTLVRNRVNRGFAAACNQGAKAAAGSVLVFLNQDTRVKPGWFRALVDGFELGPAIGLTTSKVLLMLQPDRIQACGQDVHYTGLVFVRGFRLPADSLNTPQEVAAVSGASFAVRKPVWEALGGFDETLYMYYEETDLSWRAQLAGYRCLYVPGSMVCHDYRPSPPSPSRLYYSIRNRHVMLLKNWRWMTLLFLAPGLLLAELVEWGLALAHGWVGLQAKLRADLWVVTHLRDIGRLRRRVQAERKVSDAAILQQRVYRLQPREVTGGPVGRAVVAVCNALFSLHHRVARLLCWAMGL